MALELKKDQIPELLRTSFGPVLSEMVDEAMKKGAERLKGELIDELSKSNRNQISELLSAKKSSAPAPIPDNQKGFALVRAARALAFVEKERIGGAAEAAEVAKKYYHDDAITQLAVAFLEHKATQRQSKALAAQDFDQAGALTVETISADFVELLRNQTAVRRLGANTVPMPGGTLTLMEQTGGATAEYIGENAGQNESAPTFGQIKLTAKKLRVTVAISNDLLLSAARDADQLVRNDMVAQARIKEDLAFIRNLAATDFEPKGLLGFATDVSNVNNSQGSPTLATVTEDLGTAVVTLANDNVMLTRPAWIFAPRTWNYLMTVRDGNGNYAFRDEMLGGTLWGWPFVFTNQIPTNLGGGSNESEVYLVDLNDTIIGEQTGVDIEASREASYRNSAGTLVSAYDLDQTVLRLIMRHDFQMRHKESVSVLDQVVWGT